MNLGFPGGLAIKNPPANAGDTGDSGSVPGLGRSPGEGSDNPLQYSCLGNPMHRGAWKAVVHGGTNLAANLAIPVQPISGTTLLSFVPDLFHVV